MVCTTSAVAGSAASHLLQAEEGVQTSDFPNRDCDERGRDGEMSMHSARNANDLTKVAEPRSRASLCRRWPESHIDGVRKIRPG